VDGLRISGMPNAGFPKREGDRIVYRNPRPNISRFRPRSRRSRGAHSRRLLRHHARAYPRHGQAVKSLRPVRQPPLLTSKRSRSPLLLCTANREQIWKKLQKNEFTVCVEIDPPKGIALDRVYEQVDKIMASRKVDAIDINSGAMARSV